METLVLDRMMPADTLFSFMGVDRIMAVKQGYAALLTPTVEEMPAKPSADTMSIDDICNRHVLSLENFKFDRDEVNNYE